MLTNIAGSLFTALLFAPSTQVSAGAVSPNPPAPEVVCTPDTKSCGGGLEVARDPRNGCQFPDCPDVPIVFPPPPPPISLCTTDVKLCEDGSFVSRDIFNDCQFFPCPPPEPVFCTDDAKQCQDGSYVSRDPSNDCEFFPCPPHCDDGSVLIGDRCCRLTEGCRSRSQWAMDDWMECGKRRYRNKCKAMCDGYDFDMSPSCKPCEKDPNFIADKISLPCMESDCLMTKTRSGCSECAQFQSCIAQKNGQCGWGLHKHANHRYMHCMAKCRDGSQGKGPSDSQDGHPAPGDSMPPRLRRDEGNTGQGKEGYSNGAKQGNSGYQEAKSGRDGSGYDLGRSGYEQPPGSQGYDGYPTGPAHGTDGYKDGSPRPGRSEYSQSGHDHGKSGYGKSPDFPGNGGYQDGKSGYDQPPGGQGYGNEESRGSAKHRSAMNDYDHDFPKKQGSDGYHAGKEANYGFP